MRNFISTLLGFFGLLLVFAILGLLFCLFDQQMKIAFAKDNIVQSEPIIVQEHSEEKAIEYEEATNVYRVVKFYVQFDTKFIDVQGELGKYSTLTFVDHPSCQKDPHLMAAEIEEDKYYKITTIMDVTMNERDRIVVNLESPE